MESSDPGTAGGRSSALPRGLHLLWGIDDRPRRPGPKPSLTVHDIAGAAIEIADAEGLDGVSMGRVADALGYTTMSLYRYVTDKDDLLQVMLDVAIGAGGASAPGTPDWRAGLEHLAHQLWAAYRRHPWATDVPTPAPPVGPNHVATMERALALLVPAGLRPDEALSVLILVAGYIRNHASLTRDLSVAGREQAAVPPPEYAATLASLPGEDRFPHLMAAVRAGVFEPDGMEWDRDGEDFEFGLARILDGTAVLIADRAGPGRAVRRRR